LAAVPVSRLLWTWLPILAWAAVIFALSSVPGLGTGLGFWDLVLRKLAHAVEFAVLGLLLARALPELYALLAGIGYAALDELHQHFVPGRVGALQDVAIDAVGVLVGILLWRWLLRPAEGRAPASGTRVLRAQARSSSRA
jgi:hypothetical protein